MTSGRWPVCWHALASKGRRCSSIWWNNPGTSAKYKPDGEYIPRTYFLSADGELQADIHEQRPNFLYFYNESDPAGLLRGMDAALAKLAAKG